ncbi:MAG: bifunctional precorrin-2 dehydrogenase/sirohydrochlorin ferrochelatase [Oscillospiraceae bacterium]|nr:bifunctional precorrin-2 dehydrogenase/sirohydrochlorin ferrochelatase [Oscillospiraceae bacterium]
MGWFPLFVELAGRRCVIVGGGTVALRKAEKLLPFSPEITVIAPEICDALRALPVQCVTREFRDDDLTGAFLAIAATDDRALNHHIFVLCTAQNIQINAVDDAENCSFLFPALVQEPEVTVGICTGGQSPVFAAYLRAVIEEELDTRTLETARILTRFRPAVHRMFDTGAQRKEAMNAILDFCLLDGDLPDDSEIAELLEKIHEHHNRNEKK